MFNNRFNRFNDDDKNNRDPLDPKETHDLISKFLKMDDKSEVSFGTSLEEKYSISKHDNNPKLGVDEFSYQLRKSIEDCFEGFAVADKLGSILYVLPDQTVFKIEISKLL